MSRRPGHPCKKPGCAAIVGAGDGAYCAEHARPLPPGGYDEQRPSAARRGYGRRWQRLRAMFLSANPICKDPDSRHCGEVRPATDVDHITPKAQGGRYVWENLQPLCPSCHSAKTATQSSGWATGKGDRISGGDGP